MAHRRTAPERTCVGCRTRYGVDALVRWRLGTDGVPTTSPSAAGRGAWVCAGRPDCIELAVRRKAFERAWKTPVPPSALARLTGAVPAPTADMRQ